jgi:ABC-2 type transport system permease protein
MKLTTLIHREYITRARTKGFLVFTFIVPLLMAGFLFMEFKIIDAGKKVHTSIAVMDLSHQLYPALTQVLDSKQFTLRPVETGGGDVAAAENRLRQEVLDHDEDGYLVIPADVVTSRHAEYHARNTAALSVNAGLQSHLRQAVNQVRMQAAGISASQIAAMNGDFDLREVKINAQGDSRDNGSTAMTAMALVLVLYVALLIWGVTVMRAVTEEKTTRISEVLLASVDPFTLMLGKILGIVTVAFTQFGVWALALGLASAYALTMAHAAGTPIGQYIPSVGAWLMVVFVVFFLLGFLLYASIYAAIGSMVSSDQEAQQTQLPLTMILLAALYLAFLVMASPTTPLSVALSMIPFFAPVCMVMRVAVSNPPVWQVLVSAVLCLGTFLLFTKITAKIYRVGILMTGKRPNLPELLRWIKFA